MMRPLSKTEAKNGALAADFETPPKGADTKINRYPPPPWTVDHWITHVIARPESVWTYDETIQCPSPWTVDQWMKAISLIPGISYDEAIQCPSLDTGCS